MRPTNMNRHSVRQMASAPKRRRPAFRIAATAVSVLLVVLFLHVITNRTAAAIPRIQSGVADYCLNVHAGSTSSGMVDTEKCSSDPAQAWTATQTSIRHGNNACLSVLGDGISAGSKLTVSPCSDGPGQIWLRDKNGFINPNSELCLALPGGKTGAQLILAPCGLLDKPAETWNELTPANRPADTVCPSAEGQRVACYAIKEWIRWQADPTNHTALLDQYTDGTPYEAWCADFISYVYKQAGYAFTNGSADGWDENDANMMQDMGFTEHDPASYTPQPGDIAYFNYAGGHVEIVVVGGKHPSFIYGDSAEIDPVTGNGAMKANGIIDDGAAGHLVYYLSPNRS